MVKKRQEKRIGISLFIVLILIVLIANLFGKFILAVGEGGTLYWVGAPNGNWSNINSWASSSGGAGGAGLPNSTNAVIFDSANTNNSVIDAGFIGNVYSINVSIGYYGNLTQQMNWNNSLNVTGNVIISNGTLTHWDNSNAETYRLNMKVGGNFTLETGGMINVTGLGYDGGQGPGTTTSIVSGGSYGGTGGEYFDRRYGRAGPTYGSITSPVNLGSGTSTYNPTGSGGGAIILNVTGITNITGTIISLGVAGNNNGGGAGGSIFIISQNIAGLGTISAAGGVAGNLQYGYGGGGRVAVILTSGTDFGNLNIDAYGGNSSISACSGTKCNGAAGTVYLKKATDTYGQLLIDNNNQGVSSGVNTLISANTTYDGTSKVYNFDLINISRGGQLEISISATLNLTNTNLITDNRSITAARLIIQGNNLTFGSTFTLANATLSQKNTTGIIFNTNFIIEDGGILTHEDNSGNETDKLNLTINGNLTIMSGGVINVTGLGYNGGYGPGGNFYNGICGSGGNCRVGGAYGGLGGAGDASSYVQSGGNTYGSITSPTNLGSGGSAGNTPASGGGAIILNVTGNIIVNGSLISDGGNDCSWGGGGSGGTVYINALGFSGNGTVSSIGGIGCNAGGSGGGGRIAVYLTNGTDFGNINFNAYGGNKTIGTCAGAAGTVYLKKATDTYGQLIIDNNNKSTFYSQIGNYTALTLISENVTGTIVGDVVIRNAGILNVSVYNLTKGYQTSLTIYGNLNVTNGNFSTGINSTVVLAGHFSETPANTTIYGNFSFYNLNITKKGGYVIFPLGVTNVTNQFNVQGNSSDYAYLRGMSDGVGWKINVSSSDVKYANTKDSNNTGNSISAYVSVNVSNNFGWNFLVPNVSFTGITPSNNTYTLANSVYVNVSSQDLLSGEHSVFVDFDNSLVMWMRMDDRNASGDPLDYLGRNNGSAKSGANYTPYGKLGGAFSFINNSYVVVKNSVLLNVSYFTVSFWMKTEDLANNNIILSNGYTSTPFIFYEINGIRFLGGGGLTAIVPETGISNNKWHNIIGTFNGTNIVMYIDGSLNISASATTIVFPDHNFGINAYPYGGYAGAAKQLDDVMIFNRSLSASEISALYNTQANQYYRNFTGLSDGAHTFKAYSQDLGGNVNLTELRTVTIDTTNPNLSAILPYDNQYINNGTYNFTANVSDTNLKNATLHIYNQTGLWNTFSQTVSGTAKIIGETVVGLFDGIYKFFWSIFDLAGNQFTTTNRTLIIDLTYPLINFTSPTPVNNSGVSGNLIANVSVSDLYLANFTYNWNGKNYTYGGNYTLFTPANLTQGLVLMFNFDNETAYGENSTKVVDFSGYSNNGTATNGAVWNSSGKYGGAFQFDGNSSSYITGNSSVLPNGINLRTISAWFKTNFSDGNYRTIVDYGITGQNNKNFGMGIQGTSGNLYVSQWGQAVFTSGTSYNDNTWHLFSLVYNSSLYIIYVDGQSKASGTMTTDTVLDLFWIGGVAGFTNFNGSIDEVQIWNRSLSENEIRQLYQSQLKHYYNTGENYTMFYPENGTVNVSMRIDDIGGRGQNWTVLINQSGLGIGQSHTYKFTATDLANNINSTETRTVLGNAAPSVISLIQSINATEDLDPGLKILITLNATDSDNNFNSAILQWKNLTGNYGDNNITMDNLTAIGVNNKFNASLPLPSYESNITYRVMANDTIGEYTYSSNYTIQSFWDCSWASISSLGATAGWDTNKFIGNITINNTGDPGYSVSNCSLDFRLTYDLEEGRIYYDEDYIKPSDTYTISAKENASIKVNATFGTEIKSESVKLSVSEFRGRTNTTQINITATLVTNREGPYLYQKITSNPTSVYLTAGNISLEGYIRNLMGDVTVNNSNTAYNVSFYWSLPSGLTNITGNLTQNYTNITDNEFHYNNIYATFTDLASMSSGVKAINLYAFGDNLTSSLIEDANNLTLLNEQANISFLCYNVSDSLCVTACGHTQDPDCSAATTTVTTTTSSSSSGSGGGGAGTFTSEYGERTEAGFELLAGKKQEFVLKIDNKFDSIKKNIKISVSGIDPKDIELIPDSIDYLGPKNSAEITVKIKSPVYSVQGEQKLYFTLKGEIVTGVSAVKFTDKKTIILYLLEMPREEATDMLGKSKEMIDSMKIEGMIVDEYMNYLASIESDYNRVDFKGVKDNFETFKKIYDAAFESKSILEDLTAKITEAQANGINVLETKKALYVAEVAYKRGDYLLALERLKEAKLTYALEVKGEFNLLYSVKNNPIKAAGILIGTVLLTLTSTLFIRMRLYKRKLRLLGEEEKVLLELMKVVQRETFENNHLSMEEYGEAMSQYEIRLSKVIEERIRIETKIANLLKIKGKNKALIEEKKKLIDLVKDLQDKYLNKGQIETRVYENMIKSYSAKLGEIEEELAFLEAKKVMKGGVFKKSGEKNE